MNTLIKTILPLILITFLSHTANALTLDLGFKGGIGGGSLSETDATPGKEPNWIFHGGIGFVSDIGLTSYLSIESGIFYQSKGTEFDGFNRLEIDYLQIPILAKVYFYKGLWVGAGPYFSFYLGHHLRRDSISLSAMDLGLTVALGQKFPINSKKNIFLTADMLFDYGLINTVPSGNQSFYNRSLMFNIGLQFRVF